MKTLRDVPAHLTTRLAVATHFRIAVAANSELMLGLTLQYEDPQANDQGWDEMLITWSHDIRLLFAVLDIEDSTKLKPTAVYVFLEDGCEPVGIGQLTHMGGKVYLKPPIEA